MRNILNLNKLRLKWKVFLFLLGFCAILLTVLWMFQTVFLDDMYKFIRTRELKYAIDTVEKEIFNSDLQTILYNIQVENDIIVALTPDFIPPQRPGHEIRGRRDNVPIEAITRVKEFTLQNGQIVSLTFYALTLPVNATVTTLRYQLYLISGIMLVLAVILSVIISGRISKPIEDINRGARTLAKGKYDMRFTGRGFFEIVELSETLNTAAAELSKVEDLRRELMANVSHDLRTPLALIYSYAEMMNDFPGEITEEQTKVIMDEARRLTTLVNDVLDISKLESNMEQLVIKRFNLTGSIRSVTERVQRLLKSDGFEIIFNYEHKDKDKDKNKDENESESESESESGSGSDVYVNADETKIERAFYNLLVNAVNYSGDSRVVTVTQTVAGNCVRISVTDNGEGILESDLPFIWDRYFKSGKKHKRAVTGTGLGLSIVKKIIELHSGSYGVASEVCKGSTFWFELCIS